jgi:hypothetical protein
LPSIGEEADIRLNADHGAGVIELLERVSREDGGIVVPERHGILVGTDAANRSYYLEPNAGGVLIAGSSGIGKSTWPPP